MFNISIKKFCHKIHVTSDLEITNYRWTVLFAQFLFSKVKCKLRECHNQMAQLNSSNKRKRKPLKNSTENHAIQNGDIQDPPIPTIKVRFSLIHVFPLILINFELDVKQIPHKKYDNLLNL